MINFYSNMSFDEMMKEISYENFDLFIELESRINQKVNDVYSKIESEQDETDNFMLHSIEAMEYFCSPDLKWVKEEQKKIIRYYVQGFDEGSHYDNHNISIHCDKDNRTSWKVQINCGILGETGSSFVVNGNFKEAQKQAIEKAKYHLKRGDHFIMT